MFTNLQINLSFDSDYIIDLFNGDLRQKGTTFSWHLHLKCFVYVWNISFNLTIYIYNSIVLISFMYNHVLCMFLNVIQLKLHSVLFKSNDLYIALQCSPCMLICVVFSSVIQYKCFTQSPKFLILYIHALKCFIQAKWSTHRLAVISNTHSC